MKFHEKIFTTIKVNQLLNFGNFGIPEIIPKSPVALRFSKVSLHGPKPRFKCFQMSYYAVSIKHRLRLFFHTLFFEIVGYF